MKTVDFSETIAASDLKGSGSRHLVSIEGQAKKRKLLLNILSWLFY